MDQNVREREKEHCNENEITATARCQDRGKDRAEVREKGRERKRCTQEDGEEERGVSSCCCEEKISVNCQVCVCVGEVDPCMYKCIQMCVYTSLQSVYVYKRMHCMQACIHPSVPLCCCVG